MTTANKVTIARILMIPLFVMMAIYYGRDKEQWQRWCAIGIFLAAAASDGIDGYLARRFNQRSRLGVILDPIADKGLLLAGIITLSLSNWTYEFPIWFPVLVVTRDIVIVGGALALHYLNGTVRIRPSWVGKTATVLQMIALALCMLQLPLFSTTFAMWNPARVITALDLSVWLAGLFTLLSGIGYVADGLGQLHDHGHAEAEKRE